MHIDDVIKELQSAPEGNRRLDGMIAECLGWRKTIQNIPSDEGKIVPKTLWLVPSTNDVGRFPLYTSNLQDALNLANQFAPNHVGGCSWEDGDAHARIDENGPYMRAATPQLALCAAAFDALRRRNRR